MRKIIAAQIGTAPKSLFGEMPKVKVTFDDGEEKTLFEFYPDEISFTKSELIGLTEDEAYRLRHKKDVTYLQSTVRCPDHRNGGATRCPRGGAALQIWQRKQWGD